MIPGKNGATFGQFALARMKAQGPALNRMMQDFFFLMRFTDHSIRKVIYLEENVGALQMYSRSARL